MKIEINLIPPDKKKKLINNQRLKIVLNVEIVLTIIIAGFFLMLGIFNYILDFNINSYQKIRQNENREVKQFKELEEYDSRFKQINNQIAQIYLIEQDQFYWSKILIRLSELVPPEIKLNSLITNNYKITLEGTADNRDELIGFKKKLMNEPELINVDLPLSNLVDKNNIEFQISFEIKENYLKNK